MRKKVFKNYIVPIGLMLGIAMIVELIIFYPKQLKSLFLTGMFGVLVTIYFFIDLFFVKIQISENELQIGTGYKVKEFEDEIRKKGIYSFPFKDLAYVNCVHRLEARIFTFSIILIKKNGKKYEIELTEGTYKNLRKTLKLYFENYKKNHPEEFFNIDLSKMRFEECFVHLWI